MAGKWLWQRGWAKPHVRRVHELVCRAQSDRAVRSALEVFAPKELAAALALVCDALDEDEPALTLRQHEIPQVGSGIRPLAPLGAVGLVKW